MASISLKIDDSIYEKFRAMLDLMPKNKVEIIYEDLASASASFILSSEEEVRNRVQTAEKRGNYSDHESFWNEMDDFIESAK